MDQSTSEIQSLFLLILPPKTLSSFRFCSDAREISANSRKEKKTLSREESVAMGRGKRRDFTVQEIQRGQRGGVGCECVKQWRKEIKRERDPRFIHSHTRRRRRDLKYS